MHEVVADSGVSTKSADNHKANDSYYFFAAILDYFCFIFNPNYSAWTTLPLVLELASSLAVLYRNELLVVLKSCEKTTWIISDWVPTYENGLHPFISFQIPGLNVSSETVHVIKCVRTGQAYSDNVEQKQLQYAYF